MVSTRAFKSISSKVRRGPSREGATEMMGSHVIKASRLLTRLGSRFVTIVSTFF